MDVIVTHHMADFDALACAVAARRLYAGATIALPSRLAPEVRDYLTIHRDRFPAASWRDVDQERVRRLICVDVRQRSRLRDFSRVLARVDEADARLDVVVWDHHAAHADDLPADEEHVAQTGAAVTLLIEAIDARGLHVDPEEATLFALGIDADTGSLSHHNATSRDAKALAWTMERGASQAVIDRYLNPPLSPGQRAALAGVLSHVQPEVIDGVPVGIAVVPLRAHVDGLSVVTWHASRFERYAALVTLYVVKGTRLQVIGRARSPVFDLGLALATFGGGGHRAAASATVQDLDPDEARRQLVEALRRYLVRPTRVSDLMSRPVETVQADTPLTELRVRLVRLAISGMPVLREGHLVGLVSRTDVDKAAREGRLHLPVASCMSHNVRTAQPAMLLEAALEEMTRGGVGRLPVLERGELVGIITRTDIREALYLPNDSRRSVGGVA